MNELKFSCPHCDQHIAADSGWSGLQVSCPACAVSFVVPKQAGTPQERASRARSSAAQTSVPPPELGSEAEPQSARSFSKLSIACMALCLSGIGVVPGLVCGHLARRQIRRHPSLKGNGLALAGLVIGYAGVGFVSLLIGLGLLLPVQLAKSVSSSSDRPFASSQAKPMKAGLPPGSSSDPVRAEFLALKGSPGWETISFRVSNLTSKPITELTLQYTFCDAEGQPIEKTQIVKSIEPPLAGNETQELSGMAFPPKLTKRVDIAVFTVRFLDDTHWQGNARVD